MRKFETSRHPDKADGLKGFLSLSLSDRGCVALGASGPIGLLGVATVVLSILKWALKKTLQK